MASTIRSDRDKPDVTRTWNRREEKVAKRLTHQRCYIGKCVNRLKARVKTNADFIFQLRKYLFRNITELLHTADECLVSGGDGGGAEAGEHPTGKDALPLEASSTQRDRLFQQAMAITEVLEQQRDRDLLQLGK